MKRRFLAIFAVLLVLLLATCDNSEGTGDDQAIPEGMARLTIKVDDGSGAGKALISAAGSTAADYYEVVFHMGGTYYQAEWAKAAGPGEIIVPEGTYGTADAAVMFAGKNNSGEKTLLGVGVITTPAGGVIPSGPVNVTFTVYSLTNAVSTDESTSSFQITGPTNATGSGYNYATNDNANSFKPNPIKATTTSSYPVFIVPGPAYANTNANGVDVAATYGFSIPSQASNAVILDSSGWTNAVSIITGATLGTIDGEAPVGGTAAPGSISGSPGAAGQPLTGAQTITFKINLASTSGTGGLAGVLINVPVYALTTTATTDTMTTPNPSGSTISWVIRGGSSLTTPENGVNDATNTGAIVLLGVGVHGKGNATLTIPNPTW